MSCVYCAPKSRIRMRWAWMSGDAVIRRFLRDRHIVHVALAHSRARDAHERRPRAHRLDVLAPGVAHRRAQAARKLLQDRTTLPLYGTRPSTPSGTSFSSSDVVSWKYRSAEPYRSAIAPSEPMPR